MLTTLEVMEQAKPLLKRHRTAVLTLTPNPFPKPTETVLWAKQHLGFDPRDRAEVAYQQQTSAEKIILGRQMEMATLLGACDLVPFSPQSVANYMACVTTKTAKRPSEAFAQRFNYGLIGGLRHFATDLLFGEAFASKRFVPQTFEEVHSFSGDQLTAAILYRRLQVHPETASLDWFTASVMDFKDDVPEFVLHKARQLVQSARVLKISGLQLEVVFSAAAMPARIARPGYAVGGVSLPVVTGNVQPYLDRQISIDYETARRDAERFRAIGNGTLHRFSHLQIEEQLRVDLAAARREWEKELARADPFLVVRLDVDAQTTVREIVEVWNERDFEATL